MTLDEDDALLEEALANDELADNARLAFDDMREKLTKFDRPLTPKQRTWVLFTLGRGGDLEETYENAWSAGKVPKGRDVTLLVKDKPLKPPPRRT